ncbi:PDZ domain-containing protein [Corallococcus sp. M34]|uniref:S41 family peptidase n=1 Tax=Citreicoccus inhibens TaxID=2849499 RepID=UPI001C231DBF|nr:S41 family peptidase [Citreicoccus inhibens]MBU8898102.1 PDZ domain-containing protein [Citreicoccus inhibens]
MRPLLLALGLALSACATRTVPAPVTPTVANTSGTPESLVDEAWGVLLREFMNPEAVKRGEDVRHAGTPPATQREAWARIRAITTVLNEPATRLLEPEQREGLERELAGGAGVGVGLPEVLGLDVDSRSRTLMVVTPLRDSPASRAGIHPGDIVESIDGRPARGMKLEVAGVLLRGVAGTPVSLEVRHGTQVHTVTLVREQRDTWLRPVQWRIMREGGRAVGYVRVEMFSAGTANEVRAALAALRKEGADRLMLDLRHNPGGRVDEVLRVAALFLGPVEVGLRVTRSEGDAPLLSRAAGESPGPSHAGAEPPPTGRASDAPVASRASGGLLPTSLAGSAAPQLRRAESAPPTGSGGSGAPGAMRANSDGALAGRSAEGVPLWAEGQREVDGPLVVLVDGGTASAAELLAGALQAHGRAVLVGRRSHGKGLVHGLFPLVDGSALMVSVGKLRTPRGRELQDEPLVPEVVVPWEGPLDALPGVDDPQSMRALQLLTR